MLHLLQVIFLYISRIFKGSGLQGFVAAIAIDWTDHFAHVLTRYVSDARTLLVLLLFLRKRKQLLTTMNRQSSLRDIGQIFIGFVQFLAVSGESVCGLLLEIVLNSFEFMQR